MIRVALTLIFGVALLTACVSETVKSTQVPALDAPNALTPEADLLDVGVVILDPGISAVEDEELVYPEVRRAEATFMATELTQLLTEQGAWAPCEWCLMINSSPICSFKARFCAPTAKPLS